MAPLERVAQLVEHLTFNQRVPGSSPGALTKGNNGLPKLSVCFWFDPIAW